MLPIFLTLAFILCRVGSQVVLTVLPVVVEPDVTPSFTLTCSISEQQQGQIVSISIFRRSVTGQQAKVSPKEIIAEIRGPAPGQVFVVSSHVNLTAQGQIALSEAEVAQLEAQVNHQVWANPQEQQLAVQKVELAAVQAEFGSYLAVIWPAPSVQDLGVYTCEANVLGAAAGVTFFAEVQVTSSTAATDRLLVNILNIERQANIFNTTLTGIQSEVSNITAGSDTKRLTEILENLGFKLDRFNDTLERLDRIITAIEVKVVELSPTYKTSEQQVVLDEVRHNFTIVNASYVLFYRSQNATADRAQTVCRNKQLQLAEINSTEDFQIISNDIALYVDNSSLVVVGGRRVVGQNNWSFQDGQQVTFFAGSPVEASNSTSDECLALSKSSGGFSFIPLPCNSDIGFLFFLFQQGANVN